MAETTADKLSNRDDALQSDTTTLGRGIGVALSGSVAGQILNALTQVLMARFLGVAQFGLYAIGWTLIRILAMVAPLGMHTGLMYYGVRYGRADPPRFRSILRQSIIITAISGSAVALAAYALAPWLATHIFGKPAAATILRWFAPGFALSAIQITASAGTRITRRVGYSTGSDNSIQGSNLLLFVIFALLGGGLLGAVAATVLALGIGAALALFFLFRLFPQTFVRDADRPAVAKDLLRYSLPLVASSAAVGSGAFIDRLFVSSYGSAADMGAYQAASQLSLMFGIMYGAFSAIFSPMIADICHRGDTERMTDLFKISSKWALYAASPLFVSIVFVPADILGVLYGQGYERSATALVILSAGQMVSLAAGMAIAMLTLTGRQKLFVTISVIALGIEILIGALVVPRIGMTGAALAATAAWLTLHGGSALIVCYSHGVTLYDRRHLKVAGASLAAIGAMTILVPELSGLSPFARVIATLALSYAIFNAAIIGMGLDQEDLVILRAVRTALCPQA